MPQLDQAQIVGLVSIALALVVWIGAWRNERRWARWMKDVEEDAKRKDDRRGHGGPWGG